MVSRLSKEIKNNYKFYERFKATLNNFKLDSLEKIHIISLMHDELSKADSEIK